jgi:(p)ppGpp synthase/HD superfamily hydrolase
VLAEIRRRFGDGVAAIVSACSDDAAVEPGAKRPWLERKTAYLAHLADAPLAVLRVSASDKLHNLRSILADLREVGPAVFDRFKAGRVGTLWYYRSLVEIFAAVAETERDAGLDRLAGELRRGVEALEAASPE